MTTFHADIRQTDLSGYNALLINFCRLLGLQLINEPTCVLFLPLKTVIELVSTPDEAMIANSGVVVTVPLFSVQGR